MIHRALGIVKPVGIATWTGKGSVTLSLHVAGGGWVGVLRHTSMLTALYPRSELNITRYHQALVPPQQAFTDCVNKAYKMPSSAISTLSLKARILAKSKLSLL